MHIQTCNLSLYSSQFCRWEQITLKQVRAKKLTRQLAVTHSSNSSQFTKVTLSGKWAYCPLFFLLCSAHYKNFVRQYGFMRTSLSSINMILSWCLTGCNTKEFPTVIGQYNHFYSRFIYTSWWSHLLSTAEALPYSSPEVFYGIDGLFMHFSVPHYWLLRTGLFDSSNWLGYIPTLFLAFLTLAVSSSLPSWLFFSYFEFTDFIHSVST